MAFHITHRCGAMDSNPPISSLPGLLRELEDCPEDSEHASVALTHESEWCIAVMRGGYVIIEHLESDAGGERHMRDVPAAKILDLWLQLAKGDIAVIESEPWESGYK